MKSFHIIATTVLILTAAFVQPAKADIIDLQLTGYGASSDAPLVADVRLENISDNILQVSVTNSAYEGGVDPQLTYFGIQIPTAGTSALVLSDASTGNWDVRLNTQVPGDGAEEFNFVGIYLKNRGDIGLDVGETMTMQFTSIDPIFSSINLANWEGTPKHDRIMAAKFQRVGADGEDSGVAGYSHSVPEPASAALMIPGMILLLGRNRRKRTA